MGALPRSTVAGSPPAGKGYVEQGRPYFLVNRSIQPAPTLRQNVASPSGTGVAETAPATNGREQFFEIRCNLYRYDSATSSYDDIETTNAALTHSGWSGVVVCLYGKMALVE